MSDTTVTVRGVDSRVWKKFQKGIVSLHGNLYGNIGQEVTNALDLWLRKNLVKESAEGIPANRIHVSYDDVGGLKEEIASIRETLELPLRHPELFKHLNLVPPKGILVYGAPGTGKNILTRAATAEAKAWLYILNIKQVVTESNEMKLRGIFERAKESAPSVIYIPDLRMLDSIDQSLHPVDQVVSWLVSELDALEDFCRVSVVGIVTSPEELEPSLRRRFTHQIEVRLPDRQGRYQILKIQTKKMPLADDVDLEKLADMTDQSDGYFLRKMCQDAATLALRRVLQYEKITDEKLTQENLDKIRIEMSDFLSALESLRLEFNDRREYL